MIVLAFDTSTKHGSVAVLNRHAILASEAWLRSQSHAEILVPSVEAVLQKAGVELADLDRLVVVNGPGSFTGVRVALNCARSLAYAAELPITCLSTDEGLVHSFQSDSQPLVYLSNAHQGLAFLSSWSQNKDGRLERNRSLEMIETKDLERYISSDFVAVGDGWNDPELKLPQGLDIPKVRIEFPIAEAFGCAVASRPEDFSTLAWNLAQPLYIRAPGAEKLTRYVGISSANLSS